MMPSRVVMPATTDHHTGVRMLPVTEVQCPYCGETIVLAIDDSAGPQRYIEDCQVCCRPIEVAVAFDADGDPVVSVHGEDEA
jgi:hypothetical protein